MTIVVREVPNAGPEFDRYVAICLSAFPDERDSSPEARRRFAEGVRESADEAAISLWGAYRDGTLVGTTRYFDFAMRIRSVEAFVGGVGMVATDLTHKKQGVAKALIGAFLAHYRARGATMTILHPFRHDFYRRMGWGYGTPPTSPATPRRGRSGSSARMTSMPTWPATTESAPGPTG